MERHRAGQCAGRSARLARHLAVRPEMRTARQRVRRVVPGVRLQHRHLQHLAAAEEDPDGDQHGRHRMVAGPLGVHPAGDSLRQRAVLGGGRQPSDRRPSRDREVPVDARPEAQGDDDRLRRRRGARGRRGARACPGAGAGQVPDPDLPADPGELDRRTGPGFLGEAAGLQAGDTGQLRPGHRRLPPPSGRGGVRRRGVPRCDLRPRRRPAAAVPQRAVPARPHRRRHEPVPGRGARRRQSGAGPRQRLQPLDGRPAAVVLHHRRGRRRRAGRDPGRSRRTCRR